MPHRKSRQRPGKVDFGYQTLEARTLLATITGTEGPDVFRVTADEIWINDVLYSGPLDAENTIDGLGEDDLFLISATDRGISYLGSDGNDRFEVRYEIDSVQSQEILNIDPGSGEFNELTVFAPESGQSARFEVFEVFESFRVVEGFGIGLEVGPEIEFPLEAVEAWSVVELTGTELADSFSTIWPAPAQTIRMNGLSGDDSFSLGEPFNVSPNYANLDPSEAKLYPGEGQDFIGLYDVRYSDEWNIDIFDDDGIEEIFLAADSPSFHLRGIDATTGMESITVSYETAQPSTIRFSPVVNQLDFSGHKGTITLEESSVDDIEIDSFDTLVKLVVFADALKSNIEFSGGPYGGGTVEVIGTDSDDIFELDSGRIFSVNGNRFGSLLYSRKVTYFGGGGDDSFRIFHTGFDSFFGGEGNDEFYIDSQRSASQASIYSIDGGAGENRLVALRQGFGNVLREPLIVTEDSIQNLTKSSLHLSATGGNFAGGIRLEGSPGRADDDVVRVMGLMPESPLEIAMGDGDDQVTIFGIEREGETESGAVKVFPGLGSDFTSFQDEGGNWDVSIHDEDGSVQEDRVQILHSNAELVLDGVVDDSGFSTIDVGRSSVSINSDTHSLNLESKIGTQYVIHEVLTDRLAFVANVPDQYVLHAAAFEKELEFFGIRDNSYVIEGSEAVDVFEIDYDFLTVNGQQIVVPFAGSELEIRGHGGNDQFAIHQTQRDNARYIGGEGDDEFLVDDIVSGNGSSARRVFIDGGPGSNSLVAVRERRNETLASTVFVEAESIQNATRAGIDYVATGGSFAGGIRIEGRAGEADDDFVRVVSLAADAFLEIATGDGNDFLRVDRDVDNEVRLEGGDGDDRYVLYPDPDGIRPVPTIVDSSGDADRVVAFLTSADEQIEVSPGVIEVNGSPINVSEDLEFLTVHGAAGDDSFVVNGFSWEAVSLSGNNGDDSFEVDGTVDGLLILRGNNGTDDFSFLSSENQGHVIAVGFSGDDRFRFGPGHEAPTVVDGGEGSDSYDQSLLPVNARWSRINDTGESGVDSVDLALSGSVPVSIQANGVFSLQQRTVQIGVESLKLTGTTSNESLRLNGSPASELNIALSGGQDVVEVISTEGAELLDIVLGAGNDFSTVMSVDAATTFALNGSLGNDTLFIGGRPGMADSTLDGIAGQLSLDLGDGNDRVFVVDRGAGAQYDFRSTPTRFETRGSSTRSFAGLGLSGHERFVFFGSDEHGSDVLVTPSLTTTYRFVGSSESLGVLELEDGFSGQVDTFQGNEGMISFENEMNVEFKNFSVSDS